MMDLIAAERLALADVLDGLGADQWQAQSLCARWTVAHVVAHLTMPFRITEQEADGERRQRDASRRSPCAEPGPQPRVAADLDQVAFAVAALGPAGPGRIACLVPVIAVT